MPEEKVRPALDPNGAFMQLKRRHRRFVEGIVEGLTGVDAIKRSGFRGKEPRIAASKLRARPDIQAAIAEYDELKVNESLDRRYRTIRELEFIAYFDPRRMRGPDGNILPIDQWPDDVAAAIAGIDVELLFVGQGDKRLQLGELRKYRHWSKPEALKLLAQMQKLIVERREITGKDGEALPSGPVYVIARQEAEQIGQALDDKV